MGDARVTLPETLQAYVVKIHENPDDEPRCPECGELWPCATEIMFLKGISRGRELAKERGW